MTSTLIRYGHSYLERIPANGNWGWLAPDSKWASRFPSDGTAVKMLKRLTSVGYELDKLRLVSDDRSPTVAVDQIEAGTLEVR
jgi:hypothetical protein